MSIFKNVPTRRFLDVSKRNFLQVVASFAKLIAPVKYRDLIKQIESQGWYFHRMGKGDHMIYRHATRPGAIVSRAEESSSDVPTGTQNAILRQAGLK